MFKRLWSHENTLLYQNTKPIVKIENCPGLRLGNYDKLM